MVELEAIPVEGQLLQQTDKKRRKNECNVAKRDARGKKDVQLSRCECLL